MAGEIEFPDGFDAWPPAVRKRWLDDYHALYFPKLRWWDKAESDEEESGPRPKQLPPDHPRHGEADSRGYRCGCVHKIPYCPDCPPCTGNPEWSTWLMLTARGTGKTKAGANWALEMALSKPGIYVAVCAPTFEAVRGVCIEGESGILAEAQQNNIDIRSYNKNRQELELANGSKIVGASAEKPDSIRGYNLAYVWFDELAMIRYFSFYHESLQPAMRKGDNPRLLITTTPKRVRLIRDLIEKSRWEFTDSDGGEGTGVHLTEAISAENIHFSRKQRVRLEKEYAGNPVMLAQELRGEMLAEVDGALFPIDQFNETRVYPAQDTLPKWRQVVVAIDPATTNRDSSDETGIVVAAEGEDGDYYVLEDCSGKFSPDRQMHVVAEAFDRHDADCVVGEVNMTGDYMRSLLNTVDPNIPLRSVHGMRGKVSRAQGPSSLFMQGRIHMVGDHFVKLEDQLSAMAEGDDRSRMKDDRADACLAEGTPVLTHRGDVPIEQVVPGDLTWTRAGWKPVTAARRTQRNAEVITVVLSDGRELTGTGDHRIWTENDGWKRLDALVWGDILSGWKNPLRTFSTKAASTGATRTVRAALTGSTTSAVSRAVSPTFTATSGSTPTLAKRSRTAGTSITTTRTRSITTRPTSSSSRLPSIPWSIRVISPGRKRTSWSTWTGSVLLLPSGTAQKRAGHGTRSTASAPGRAANRSTTRSAPSAEPRSGRGTTSPAAPRPRTATALAAASTAPATRTRSTARLSPARPAGTSSSATSTGRRNPRPAPVSVLGSFASSERRDVYDLTVADVHEFTANGVIVHNCVWAIIHLSGAGQGDWGMVYGFDDCGKCGARVNVDKDQRCKNCGAEVTPMPPKHPGGRPAREPWSAAYLNTCINEDCGKTYPRHERTCPHCSPSPESYMRRALSLSSGNLGGTGYSGKDILRGRRF